MTKTYGHTIWKPDFEVKSEEEVGREWPLVFVYKFECNEIGERRFVGSKIHDYNLEAESDFTVIRK